LCLSVEAGLRWDAKGVMGHICRHRWFVQAFPEGRDRGSILEKKPFVAIDEVLSRVGKSLAAQMSLPLLHVLYPTLLQLALTNYLIL
jgi:hypothetical protein